MENGQVVTVLLSVITALLSLIATIGWSAWGGFRDWKKNTDATLIRHETEIAILKNEIQ